MTGFGYAENEDSGVHISAELKSVNTRYLDIAVTLPQDLAMFESRVRSILQEKFQRGRLELTVRVQEMEDAQSVKVDESAALKWKSALEKLALLLDRDAEITLDMLIRQDGIFKVEREWVSESCWPLLESLLESAGKQVLADRKREGHRLAKDIECQLVVIESALAQITRRAPQIKEEVESMLRNQFQNFVGNGADDARVLTEIAAWIIKLDINEEIVRLSSHIDAFRSISHVQGVRGKKLDFLSQEISREINTIGSKSQRADVSRLVVDMKDAVEKIREQLRNVE